VHRIAQAKEDGLVGEGFEPVTFDRGDEQVDRIGTQVDGGSDLPGRVSPVQCPFPIASSTWSPRPAPAGSPASPPKHVWPRPLRRPALRWRAWQRPALRRRAWRRPPLRRRVWQRRTSAEQRPWRTWALRALPRVARRARPGGLADPGHRLRPRRPASDASPRRRVPSGAASRAALAPSPHRPCRRPTRPTRPSRTLPLDVLPHPASRPRTARGPKSAISRKPQDANDRSLPFEGLRAGSARKHRLFAVQVSGPWH
jgi:hypothetical protein